MTLAVDIRARLEQLEPGECLVWREGQHGTAIVGSPVVLPEDAINEYLDHPRPVPEGEALLVSEHAGWVRRYIWRSTGLEGGNLHWADTTPLRANYKPRPSPQSPEPFEL